jgi:tetratricopeptide (TPR) repeat protein
MKLWSRSRVMGTVALFSAIMFIASLLNGCTVSPDNITLPAVTQSPSTFSTLEDVVAAKDHAIMREHIAIWQREQAASRKDAFSEALAAYRIGAASKMSRWSKLSIKLFDAILESNPDFALARAWRGSAKVIYSGNFPIRGPAMVIPGPGFVRMGYVWGGFSDLNDAVDAVPNDPVIRLIRASTFIGAPAFFGGREQGMADFAMLDAWTNTPASNPENADLLASEEWRSQYYYNRGKAMEQLGNKAEANKAWQNLQQSSSDELDRELAKWYLK